jgi:hypothetical protein
VRGAGAGCTTDIAANSFPFSNSSTFSPDGHSASSDAALRITFAASFTYHGE